MDDNGNRGPSQGTVAPGSGAQNAGPADLLEVPRRGDRLDRWVELELEQRVQLDFAAQ